MTDSIAETFNEYFEIKIASDDEDLKRAYHTRYRVYCEEFSYEEGDRFPDQMEIDRFDKNSKHCVIIHKERDLTAACVRVVPAVLRKSQEVVVKNWMPIEMFCKHALNPATIELLDQNREGVCEISRLAVDPDFRRRPNERNLRYGNLDFNDEEKRLFPVLAVGLLMAANHLSYEEGWTTGLAMMEPFLPRLLRRSGLELTESGSLIDYHGERAPYAINANDARTSWKGELGELYTAIEGQLQGQVRQLNNQKLA
jgi:N-acyl amino acid synthase of PEP-CTERM/exosortase system